MNHAQAQSVVAKAFEIWETEFRAEPQKFMTTEELAAADLLVLSEQRAVYFEAIIASLAPKEDAATLGS